MHFMARILITEGQHTFMRLAAIFILLPQLLYSQSMYVIKGYETNYYNEPVNGYTKKVTSIYTGTNIYNSLEITQLIHPTWALSPTNCIVENQYVWGHYEFGQTVMDVVIKFVVTPNTSADQYIRAWVMGPFPPGTYPTKPRTRIADSFVVTGSYVDRQYCRTTWRLSNPSDQTQYFQLQYNIGAPVAGGNCYDGFLVPPRYTSDVSCRYIDLVWLYDYTKYVATDYPYGSAEGPYLTFVLPVPPYKVNYTGTAGSYFQPPIPTRKAVLDYLEVDFFKPVR